MLNVPVTVCLDVCSSDASRAIAERFATRVLPIQNHGAVVEDMIGVLSHQCATKWILRIDDDELPSMAMMQFVSTAVRDDKIEAYAFPRYQCAVSARGRLLYSKLHTVVDHQQWRLYQRDKVTYSARLHTPGFDAGKVRAGIAPMTACMVHLDWAVHTYEERLEKITRYDRHTANSGTAWRTYYLYEEDSRFFDSLESLNLQDLSPVALSIARRFPHLCIDFSNVEEMIGKRPQC